VLKKKSLVLKKKRECEREEKEGTIREGYDASLNDTLQSLVARPVHVHRKGASDPGALQRTTGARKADALAWIQI
jgi:hypothetical protein